MSPVAEHGPSEVAVEAAARLAAAPRCSDWGDGLTAARVSALLVAAHDPALGFERSVCLRDVYNVLSNAFHPQNPTDWHPADVIERAFTESSSPDREGEGHG
jgi:hypothetical protein